LKGEWRRKINQKYGYVDFNKVFSEEYRGDNKGNEV